MVPAGTVHGFQFEAGTSGFVVSMTDDLPRELAQREPAVGALFERPATVEFQGESLRAADLTQSFEMLAREFSGTLPGHALALEGLLTVILANVLRVSHPSAESADAVAVGRYRQVVARFREVIEGAFRDGWSLAEYASALNVSESRLRNACLRVTEQSPMQARERPRPARGEAPTALHEHVGERDRLCPRLRRPGLFHAFLLATYGEIAPHVSPRLTRPTGSPFAQPRRNCPEMVVLPAGTFTMGSPADEPERRDNEPQTKITIARAFAMAKTPVTWDQWEACVRDDKCNGAAVDIALRTRENGEPNPDYKDYGRGTRPVVGVSWYDAQVFVGWLNGKTHEDDSYRLPSEAEYEYAARAGTTTPFPWGTKLDHDYGNFGADGHELGGNAEGRDIWWARLRPSRRSHRMHSACTTCTATSSNGPRIATRPTGRMRRRTAPRTRKAIALTAYSAAPRS